MDQTGVSTIGRNVAHYRKLVKMSAEELASQAGEGLTRSIIANLENGRKDDLTVKQLLSVAATLRLPPLALLVDLRSPDSESPFPLPRLDPDNTHAELILLGADPTQRSTAAAVQWLRGEHRPPADTQSDAQKEVFGLLTVLDGYWRSWSRFVRSVGALHGIRELHSLFDGKLDDPTQLLKDEALAESEAAHEFRSMTSWAAMLALAGAGEPMSLATAKSIMRRMEIPQVDEGQPKPGANLMIPGKDQDTEADDGHD